MKQAEDFKSEAGRLESLLSSLDEGAFDRKTAFKGWSINEILRHLHVWNLAAYFALTDEAAIAEFLKEATPFVTALRLPEFERSYLKSLSGKALFDRWAGFHRKLADAYRAADPSHRVM
ncbi:maleylpyruvate isomerase N-terminal domain-containing protein [Hyphococcus luteus]|uniref:maleylpyruvate isomerase N-terminal domain-containing protein n=1 Tax=Hyphococcus luteus TaxID=2058213 RepID=UPI001A9C869B|nr:maleylpyruvate isomerase N-terminal domain-containing protein [Marinicaulis flavus]